MIRAVLLPLTRWARYWYELGARDARHANAPTPYGARAARLRAVGLLDQPRHRAG